MSHTNATANYELSQFLGTDKPAWLVDYNGDMLKIDTALKNIADAEAESAEDIQELQDAIGAEGLTGRITDIENDIGDIKTEIGSVELPTTAQSLTGAIAELKGVNDDQNTAIDQNTTDIAQVGGAVDGVSQLAYTIANVYDSSATYAVGAYAIYQNTLYKCTTAINVGEAFDPLKWTSVKVMSEVGQGGGGSVDADDVSYDNTSSGLTATNVQDAIDELASGSGGTVDADDVSYDNTASGLTATNVQDAIDEINSNITDPFGNTFGTIVNLNSGHTTLNTLYTTQKTGYLHLDGGSTLATIAFIAKSDISDITDTTQRMAVSAPINGHIAVLVPKGLKLGTFNVVSEGSARFIPLE